MKKIFWRVFVAFGAVLLFFTILIGLMFTRFNRTNIVGAYKQQLGDLADGVVTRTSQAVKDSEADYGLSARDGRFWKDAECRHLDCGR